MYHIQNERTNDDDFENRKCVVVVVVVARLVTQNETLSACPNKCLTCFIFISFFAISLSAALSFYFHFFCCSMSLALSEFLFWSNSLKILFYKIIVYSTTRMAVTEKKTAKSEQNNGDNGYTLDVNVHARGAHFYVNL